MKPRLLLKRITAVGMMVILLGHPGYAIWGHTSLKRTPTPLFQTQALGAVSGHFISPIFSGPRIHQMRLVTKAVAVFAGVGGGIWLSIHHPFTAFLASASLLSSIFSPPFPSYDLPSPLTQAIRSRVDQRLRATGRGENELLLDGSPSLEECVVVGAYGQIWLRYVLARDHEPHVRLLFPVLWEGGAMTKVGNPLVSSAEGKDTDRYVTLDPSRASDFWKTLRSQVGEDLEFLGKDRALHRLSDLFLGLGQTSSLFGTLHQYNEDVHPGESGMTMPSFMGISVDPASYGVVVLYDPSDVHLQGEMIVHLEAKKKKIFRIQYLREEGLPDLRSLFRDYPETFEKNRLVLEEDGRLTLKKPVLVPLSSPSEAPSFHRARLSAT